MPVQVQFVNNRSEPVELVMVQGLPTPGVQVLANLGSGQQHSQNCPDGFSGNFKHTQGGRGSGPNGEGVTLFEITVKTDDRDQVFYDLSLVDGFNGGMTVRAPDGATFQALSPGAPDAYLFDKDDEKTRGLGAGVEGTFVVTFV